MAGEAARNPGGRVSSVYRRAAERQGAYDFLESEHVCADAILNAAVDASCRRASDFPVVFVPLDGTSLNLTDLRRAKDFGSVGARSRGARGLKVVDGIMVAPDGTPIGIAAMKWWARGAKSALTKDQRAISAKELQHWIGAIDATCAALARVAPQTRAWFQLDREGDAQDVLEKLADSGQLFTVRSQSDRRLSVTGHTLPHAGRVREKRRRYLRAYMNRKRPLARELLELPARGNEPARLACVAIRTGTVVVRFKNRQTSRCRTLALNVVWVREEGRGRRKPSLHGKTMVRTLDWMLLTNHAVASLEEARAVIDGYTQRWRIEDFHRAWKGGACNVEDSQLRTRAHVIKWATLLAAVAVRTERLKHLSREQPRAPATIELSPLEVEALILLKRRYASRNESIGDDTPDLETATRWIAQLGGYIGAASGTPPGTTTIARGLAQLHVATAVLQALRSPPRSD